MVARRNAPPVHGRIVVPQDVGFAGPEATVAYKFTYAKLLSENIPVNVIFGHDLPLMASSRVTGNDRRAVGQKTDAGFVASDGSEYGGYRRFFRTVPAQLR